MSRARTAPLLAGTIALVALDVARLAAAGAPPAGVAFAQATCGIGLGPVTSPEWSFFSLDPRTQAACESELFP
ncbi:MAG TPA: hypothetical protein VLL94_04740, partial [Nitrospiraceae bacterium]|nr:hypothetical protein [Nitrospiraceae bacterium]